ncbi:KIAA0947-like isoform B [Alligator mississippiensis]|uniref:KIAA0947-like isoform B n=1 Tax=Alligator mississippiensis TaxID=8496 RepID=A0A151NDQ8_ALLMI|nr:KIAA0947-like isoform B [Alligator mississippiensis]
MMPGETPAAAAGTAAEAVTGCANCGALQQNLNEYVAALIALKQKIFDTDRLLTDYQQKGNCNYNFFLNKTPQLQFAERENSTLRNQVEQMLQKISPLEKCQEELGSLKAELEEKKSSLKIYQESHLEYIRVKEEVTKSDAAKKKLEAKVKKLEEAATKHTQDFKQLKSEKKMLEKELKKAQEKLDDCPKQKCKKVLKHAETQSSRDDLVASIDKEKIKQLLEELWVCIDSAAGKRQNQDNDYILASVQGHSRTPEKISKFFRQEVAQTRRKPRKSEKMIPHQSSLETVIEQNSLAATQIKMDESLIDHFESKTTDESLQSCNGDSAFYEDKTIGVVVQTDCEDRSSDFSDEEEHLAGNVKDILNWIRPLPPLLSPMQLSPAVTPDTLFGDFTDSSDEEIDYCAQTVEDILEKSSEEYHVSLKEESNIQEKYEPDHDTETSSKLRVNEETSIYSDLFTAENLLITGRDAEAKQTQMVISSIDTMVNEELLEEKVESMEAEQILAEQTENMEIETGTTVQLVMPTSEVNEEKMIDDEGVQTEDKASSTERVSFNFEHLQENSNGAVQTEKDVVSNTNTVASSEHLQEKSSKLMEVGEDELPRKVDTPELSPIPKDRVPSSPQKSIFAVENECFEEEPNEMESEMVENESKGIKRKPNVVNVVLGLEDHVEQITTGKKVIAEELHVETEDKTQHPEEEDLASNFSNPKSFSGVESDEVWQCNGEETFMKTDIDTEIKDTAIESQFSEEKLSNGERLEELLVQSEEPEVNEDRGLEKASAFISATEVNRNSLSLDEANAIADVGGTAASLPTKKGEGEQLKTVELSTEGNITEVSKNSLSLDEANAIAGGSASSLSTKAGEGEQLTTGLLSTEVNIMNSEQKGFSGNSTNGKNVLEIATFSESCHVECGELLEVQEEGCLQAKLEHNQKDAGILLQKESDFEILPASPNPDCIINGENEALEPKEMDPDKHVIGQTSETKHIENMFGVLEHKLSETIKVFERQEIKMEHLEFKLGYVREKSSQLLETEKIVAENFQCSSISEKLNDKSPEEMVIKNCNNNSTDLEERHGEKMNERARNNEIDYDSSIREKPLCSERQMESPVEYPVTEIMIEENDKDLNSLGESSKDGGRTLTETPEFQEEASGSAEEDYPLRKLLAECSKIYKSVIKNSKLDAALFTSADLLERKDNEELGSNVEQSVPHEAGIETPVPGEELNDKQEETHAAFSLADFNTRASQDAINSGTSLQQTDFQKSKRENISVKSSQNLAMLSAISDPQAEYQNFESQETILENSPALELESSVDLAPQRSSRSNQKAQEPSKSIKDSAKMIDQDSQGKFLQRLSRGKGKRKTLQVQLTQQVLANTDSSTPSRCSPETIYKIRQEMGPPLPPLLLPLKATPPRTVRPASPVMTSASQSSLPSPLDDLISPLRDIPIPPLVSPLADTPKRRSPPRTCTPSPSETTVCRRILSSPLQFCAATPKHALPVPGRLPLSASGSGAPGVPQENSVKILDTMYPELSARARTLNILKGNIQLNRCAPSDSKNLPGPVSQITGFKTIASTSTAFVKTGSSSKPDSNRDQQTDLGNQQPCTSSLNQIGKRTLSTSMPRSAKRLRLDSESPRLETNDKEDVANKGKGDFSSEVQSVMGKTMLLNNFEISQSVGNSSSEMSSSVEKIIDPDSKAVSLALKKISESCFDLFPVIRSHVHVGNISKVPVMRNEEKDIVYEFGVANKHLAELLLHTILNKLKTEKTSLEHSFTHALCRVYIGICRQLGDLERARLFCYSLLKEDFPESEKLILFIVSVWQDIFSFQGVINKAVQLVARQRARGEVLKCLNAYLNWEKESPLDAGIMVSSLLLAIQLCPKLEFQSSDQYGEDLPESTWEYIFAIELLCSHLKWDWTHNNIISKELWPLMHKWIQHRKGHEAVQSIPDIIVASALRLIGRLSQIGLKERFSSAVKNISSVIGVFVQHAKEEGVPWGVQLAAVYALLDLGPSNPVGILEAIQPWRAAATNSIPTAVNSGITELSSLSTAESKSVHLI